MATFTQSADVDTSATSIDVSLTGVAAGSLLVIATTRSSDIAGVADDDSNTWTKRSETTTGGVGEKGTVIYTAFAASSGDLTVTVTRTSGGGKAQVLLAEFAVAGAFESVDLATNVTSSGTAHNHGTVDVSGESVTIAASSQGNIDGSIDTEPSGYTRLTSAKNIAVWYRVGSTTISGNASFTTSESIGASSVHTAVLLAASVTARTRRRQSTGVPL